MWEDDGYGANINQIKDNFYFSTRYKENPDLPQIVPHHLIRNLSSDLELEWTKDYLFPLFYLNENVLGINNIIREIWPDPRGGVYVVGDLVDVSDKFLETPPMYPDGQLLSRTSLLKIDEGGNELWHYKDSSDFINPLAAATLSSGKQLTTITIESITGLKMMRIESESVKSIDVSSLQNGIYILRFQNGNNLISTRKFIKI